MVAMNSPRQTFRRQRAFPPLCVAAAGCLFFGALIPFIFIREDHSLMILPFWAHWTWLIAGSALVAAAARLCVLAYVVRRRETLRGSRGCRAVAATLLVVLLLAVAAGLRQAPAQQPFSSAALVLAGSTLVVLGVCGVLAAALALAFGAAQHRVRRVSTAAAMLGLVGLLLPASPSSWLVPHGLHSLKALATTGVSAGRGSMVAAAGTATFGCLVVMLLLGVALGWRNSDACGAPWLARSMIVLWVFAVAMSAAAVVVWLLGLEQPALGVSVLKLHLLATGFTLALALAVASLTLSSPRPTVATPHGCVAHGVRRFDVGIAGLIVVALLLLGGLGNIPSQPRDQEHAPYFVVATSSLEEVDCLVMWWFWTAVLAPHDGTFHGRALTPVGPAAVCPAAVCPASPHARQSPCRSSSSPFPRR